MPDAPEYIQPDRDLFRQWVENAAANPNAHISPPAVTPVVDFLHFMAGCIANAANAGRLTLPHLQAKKGKTS